jgi:hypothetical protein
LFSKRTDLGKILFHTRHQTTLAIHEQLSEVASLAMKEIIASARCPHLKQIWIDFNAESDLVIFASSRFKKKGVEFG